MGFVCSEIENAPKRMKELNWVLSERGELMDMSEAFSAKRRTLPRFFRHLLNTCLEDYVYYSHKEFYAGFPY